MEAPIRGFSRSMYDEWGFIIVGSRGLIGYFDDYWIILCVAGAASSECSSYWFFCEAALWRFFRSSRFRGIWSYFFGVSDVIRISNGFYISFSANGEFRDGFGRLVLLLSTFSLRLGLRMVYGYEGCLRCRLVNRRRFRSLRFCLLMRHDRVR